MGVLVVQANLGVDLLPQPPGGGQPLERGAVVEARFGKAVIEEVHLERLRSLGGPNFERRTGLCHLAPEEARRRLTILYRLIYPAGKEIPASGPGPDPVAPVEKAAKPAKPPVTTPTPSTVPPI